MGPGKRKIIKNEGRSLFKKLEIQECLDLCEKLKWELKDAGCIPQERLSGELEEALKRIREFQKSKLEEIFREILILEER